MLRPHNSKTNNVNRLALVYLRFQKDADGVCLSGEFLQEAARVLVLARFRCSSAFYESTNILSAARLPNGQLSKVDKHTGGHFKSL